MCKYSTALYNFCFKHFHIVFKVVALKKHSGKTKKQNMKYANLTDDDLL